MRACIQGRNHGASRRASRGFTMVELLTVTILFAIITMAALPILTQWVQRYQAIDQVRSLHLALNTARNKALIDQRAVTVCPMLNNRCVEDWNWDLSVFIDTNNNLELDINETIYLNINSNRRIGNWITRGSTGNRIRFNYMGHAYNHSTTFVFCPESDNLNHARQVIISFQGRIRTQKYLSRAGSPYSNLGNLTCNV